VKIAPCSRARAPRGVREVLRPDLARPLVELGSAVGVIAAAVHRRARTQLTMRTFHIGGNGVADLRAVDARGETPEPCGSESIQAVEAKDGALVVMTARGRSIVQDAKGPTAAVSIVTARAARARGKIDGARCSSSGIPYNVSILTEEPAGGAS